MLTTLFLCVVAAGPAHAQGTKKPPGNPVAIATPTGQSAPKGVGVTADRLNKEQIEATQRVNLYFNQLISLRGTFIQTNADGKRERGKFYIKRPGLFRFDYALPSKLVILSDGKYIAIQDRDIGTDDRWDLEYTPFRMLLRKDVNLLRDARFFDVRETADAITMNVVEKGTDDSGRITLTLAKTPDLHIKEWMVKDAQGLDTRVVLGDLVKADDLDPSLFNPALTKQGR